MQDNYSKLVIFDLDGVLMDSRELHFDALNNALKSIDPSYVITKEEHLSTYDGLPTTRKLEILTEKKGLPVDDYDKVWKKKQDETIKLLDFHVKPDKLLIEMFAEIKHMGFKIAVASNSINKTLKVSLENLGLMQFVDKYIANTDVDRNKPHPEMFWALMTQLNAIPFTTAIVEDSHIGRRAAIDSGATLIPVENKIKDKTPILDELRKFAEKIDGGKNYGIPWKDSKLNIVIPMAGRGSRFEQAGFTFPKPLIDVKGKPMIQVVKESLNIEANYIFIVQKEHYEKYNLKYLLNLIAPGCQIIQIDGITEGAAETVLKAKDLINNENPLLIVNSDQFVEWDSNEIMYAFNADKIDGGVVVFHATHPKWSYVKLDDDGFVCEVAEKKVISDIATVGIYFWKFGEDFVWAAEEMMNHDEKRVNGEWYIAPTFQELIEDADAKIRVKFIDKMWGMGTPEDLQYFLNNYKGKL